MYVYVLMEFSYPNCGTYDTAESEATAGYAMPSPDPEAGAECDIFETPIEEQ